MGSESGSGGRDLGSGIPRTIQEFSFLQAIYKVPLGKIPMEEKQNGLQDSEFLNSTRPDTHFGHESHQTSNRNTAIGLRLHRPCMCYLTHTGAFARLGYSSRQLALLQRVQLPWLAPQHLYQSPSAALSSFAPYSCSTSSPCNARKQLQMAAAYQRLTKAMIVQYSSMNDTTPLSSPSLA